MLLTNYTLLLYEKVQSTETIKFLQKYRVNITDI